MAKGTNNAEVVIIGAGPAGLSTARLLADSGIKTFVLEKSTKAGANNFFSGVIEKEIIEDVFGKITDEESEKYYAPIERKLTEYRAYLLSRDSFIAVNERKNLKRRFIVLNEAFNNWMCKQAQDSGAKVIFETIAEELIINNSKICGVKTNSGDFYSNAVVVAEGVNSLLTKKSGLRKGEISPEQVFLFAEETIELHSDIIHERFNINEKEGVSIRLFMEELVSMPSTGYLHTNKNSITLGIGILFSKSLFKGININQCLELLKKHPGIYPLIKNGTTIHYSSYILPFHTEEKSPCSAVKRYENNCLVIGGASLLVDAFRADISSNAVLSGKLAGEAIIRAKDLNDYSKKTLSEYETLLKKHLEISSYKGINPDNNSDANNLSLFLSKEKLE